MENLQVPSLADLANYPGASKNCIEALDQPIYDIQVVDISEGKVNFFGRADYKSLTEKDTNIFGLMPAARSFLINGITIEYPEEVDQAVDDGIVKLVIGCAEYLTVAPLSLFNRKKYGHTLENNRVAYKINQPILIPCQQNFAIKCRWEVGESTFGKIKMRAELSGFMYIGMY